MEYTEWNTGRLYDDRGQLMRAAFIDHGQAIAFIDLSRNIDGIIHGQFGRLQDDGDTALRDRVMTAYDYDIYTYPRTDEEKEALRSLNKN